MQFFATVTVDGDRLSFARYDNLHDAAKELQTIAGNFADDEDDEDLVEALTGISNDLDDLASTSHRDLDDADDGFKYEAGDFVFELTWG